MAIITMGIDLAKSVFAVHGVNEAGKPTLEPFCERPLWIGAATSEKITIESFFFLMCP